VERRRARSRAARDCASEDSGEPGRCAGVLPVASSMFGTRRERCESSALSSSSSVLSTSVGVGWGGAEGGFGMSDARRISPRTPHTTAVSPSRTTALPEQWVRLPVFMVGLRNSEGVRPFGRMGGVEGVCGERWARRKGEGDRAAKISRGKDNKGAAVVVAAIGGLGYKIRRLWLFVWRWCGILWEFLAN